MTRILSEIQAMQNPALGATLIWRFACGYAPHNKDHEGIPLPLAFLVLPVVLHERTRQKIITTKQASGARKFEEKFKYHEDMLLALNPRSIEMRSLSLRSFRLALASGLVTLIPERCSYWPRSYTRPPMESKNVTELFTAAERLGYWCRTMSIYEISGILKVEF